MSDDWRSGEDDWVRTTAARTLGQLRHPDSVAALVDVLRLPYPQGRMFDPERRSQAQEEMIGLKHAAKQGLLALPLRELAEPAVRALLRDPGSRHPRRGPSNPRRRTLVGPCLNLANWRLAAPTALAISIPGGGR